MKEIHAYLNEDGTYRIEIVGKVRHEVAEINGQPIGMESVQTVTYVQRASIQINELDDDKNITASVVLGG